MHVSTTPLGELATQVLKRETFVLLGHSLPFNTRGMASYDKSGAALIELNPALFEAMDARELAHVFWHEVGHIALKHISEARPRFAYMP